MSYHEYLERETKMKKIAALFLRGLSAILPIALTLYILYWLATSAESLLGGVIKFVITKKYYVPGMGVVVGFLLTIAVGILLHMWLFRKALDLFENIFNRIPLIKSLYNSIRDMMDFFDKSQKKKFDTVVMANIGDPDANLMGLVTRDSFSDLPEGVGDEQTVAVYLPMSYQMGGFTVMIPRSKIRAVDMNVEDALQFVLTAGVTSEKKSDTEQIE
jgi:uncharacterized membrane protein